MQGRYITRSLLGFSALLLVVTALSTAAAAATNVSGSCPANGFTAAGSPWNFTGSVSIPNGTTCTVHAGATLNGNGNSLIVDGTLNAVGAGTANRNVVFNNVYVSFQSDGTGGLQYCKVNQSAGAAYITLAGIQTVTSCTITGASSYAIYVPGGTPTISNNAISGTASYDIPPGAAPSTAMATASAMQTTTVRTLRTPGRKILAGLGRHPAPTGLAMPVSAATSMATGD